MKFATTNQNKLREASEVLGLPMDGVSIDVPEIQSLDVVEVVDAKAKAAFELLGEPVLVEDSGLAFEAWNGLPGPLIKWFLTSVGNEGLLKMLASETNRRATATTAVGYFDGVKTHIFKGQISGVIADQPRGNQGFGWDALFIPQGHDRTFAEMSPEEKHGLSMRGQAFRAMRDGLK